MQDAALGRRRQGDTVLIEGCARGQERFVASAGSTGGVACVRCWGLHCGPHGGGSAPRPIVYNAGGFAGCMRGGRRLAGSVLEARQTPAARLLGCAQAGVRGQPRMQVQGERPLGRSDPGMGASAAAGHRPSLQPRSDVVWGDLRGGQLLGLAQRLELVPQPGGLVVAPILQRRLHCHHEAARSAGGGLSSMQGCLCRSTPSELGCSMRASPGNPEICSVQPPSTGRPGAARQGTAQPGLAPRQEPLQMCPARNECLPRGPHLMARSLLRISSIWDCSLQGRMVGARAAGLARGSGSAQVPQGRSRILAWASGWQDEGELKPSVKAA